MTDFWQPLTSTSWRNWHAVASADFNQDGYRDIVTADGGLTLFTGRGGDGYFEPGQIYGGTWHVSVVAADLNADGYPDLVSGGDVLELRLNDTFGGFDEATAYESNWGSLGPEVADLNGDGDLDVIAVNSHVIRVLLGRGDGTFDGPVDAGLGLGVGVLSESIAIADVDEDGNVDLLSATADGSRILVASGHGDGTFANPPIQYPTLLSAALNSTVTTLVARDFDGDGSTDVAVATEEVPSVNLMLNRNAGEFTDVREYELVGTPADMIAADLDGEGPPDLVVVSSRTNHVNVLLNAAAGNFAAEVYTAGASPEGVVAADLNGDGEPELVVANRETGDFSVLLNEGDGDFEAPPTYGTGDEAHAVVVEDFDADGAPDLAVTSPGSDEVTIMLQRADDSEPRRAIYDVGVRPSAIVSADMNGVRVMLGACTRKGADKPRVRVGLRVDIEASTACLVSDDALSDEIGSPPPNHDDLGGPSQGAPVEVLTARCKVTPTHVFADVNSYSNAFTLDTDLDSEGNGQAVLSLFARSVRDPYDSQRLGVPLVSDGPCELKAFPGSWDPSLGTGSIWASFSCPGMVAPSVTSPATPVCNVTGEVLLEHCDH